MSSRCAAVATGLLRSRSAALNIRGDVEGKDSVFPPVQDVVLHVLLGSKSPKTDTFSLFLLNPFADARSGWRPGERGAATRMAPDPWAN